MSTNVGGVPELFPPDYILLTPPTICDIVTTIKQAIVIAQKNPVSHPRIVNKQDKQLLEMFFLNDTYLFVDIIGRISQINCLWFIKKQ